MKGGQPAENLLLPGLVADHPRLRHGPEEAAPAVEETLLLPVRHPRPAAEKPQVLPGAVPAVDALQDHLGEIPLPGFVRELVAGEPVHVPEEVSPVPV